MEETSQQYQQAKAKHEANERDRHQYERLVMLYTSPDILLSDVATTNEQLLMQEALSLTSKETEIVEVIKIKTRNSYKVRPKDKLQELVDRATKLKTERQLKERLQEELEVFDIPEKTVQNKLIELDNQGVIKRVKTKEFGFLIGKPEMFDSNGNPLIEFMPSKKPSVGAEGE